ncbi:response regulator [uncultured Phyllobacterium sp.]|uniref:response regulator transcription factor n=1 Tax=uncultured Phyllobacterium sp. TaxID=253813 RepID=UPI0025878331|nr:response regulator [uncultured Phyllobacterium sp.]
MPIAAAARQGHVLMRYPVYLVDDDAAVREGLCLLFEAYRINVIAFDGPLTFLREVSLLPPGCLLLDLQMPELNGLELQKELIGKGIDWPIIIVTGYGDLRSCRTAFQSRVVDFLAKPVDPEQLFEALRKAEVLLEIVLEKREAETLFASLTPRENEIINLVCRGWGSKEIATSLNISLRTVDAHRANISEKLGTTSVAEFVQMKMRVQ